MTPKGKVILAAFLFIVIGGVLVGYLVYQASRSQGLEITITGPEKTPIGVPFDIRVNVANGSQNVFNQVRLSVNLPEDVAFLGSPVSKNVDFRELGAINTGGVSQQTFRLIALSGENVFKRITVDVSYMAGSLSSRFQEGASF